MNTYEYIGSAICILLILFLFSFWGIRANIIEKRVAQDGVYTKGIITDITSTPKGRPIYIYAYMIGDKKNKGGSYGFYEKLSIGDTITILYYINKKNEIMSRPAYELFKSKPIGEKYKHEFY